MAGAVGGGDWGTGGDRGHPTATPKPRQILLEEEQQASFSTLLAPPCSARAQVAGGAGSVLPDRRVIASCRVPGCGLSLPSLCPLPVLCRPACPCCI